MSDSETMREVQRLASKYRAEGMDKNDALKRAWKKIKGQ